MIEIQSQAEVQLIMERKRNAILSRRIEKLEERIKEE